MKVEPMVAYCCEKCGRTFTNASDCEEHERDCRPKMTCPDCRGRGKFFVGYKKGSYIGFGYYEKEKNYVPCDRCDGTGKVNKY